MQVLVRVPSLFDIPPSDRIFNVTVRSQAIDYDSYSLALALYPKQPFSNIFSLFHLHKSLSLPLSIARFVSPVGLCEVRSHVFPLVEAQPNMETVCYPIHPQACQPRQYHSRKPACRRVQVRNTFPQVLLYQPHLVPHMIHVTARSNHGLVTRRDSQ